MPRTKHTPEAMAYATSRVGERGERHMPNEYEWDAIADAFTAGQKAQWIDPAKRLPPYGEEIITLRRGNDNAARAYISAWRGPDEERHVLGWMPVPPKP